MSRHITRGEGFQGKGTGRVKAWNEPSFDRGSERWDVRRSDRVADVEARSNQRRSSERGSVRGRGWGWRQWMPWVGGKFSRFPGLVFLTVGVLGTGGTFQRLYDSDIGDAIQVSRNSNRSA